MFSEQGACLRLSLSGVIPAQVLPKGEVGTFPPRLLCISSSRGHGGIAAGEDDHQ